MKETEPGIVYLEKTVLEVRNNEMYIRKNCTESNDAIKCIIEMYIRKKALLEVMKQ